MQRDKVFMFTKSEEGKIEVDNPSIETFGATFDTIIERCFDIRPPISDISRNQIKKLMDSQNPEEIREGIQHLGNSVEKAFLSDHLRQIISNKENA
jgi:hypothetical protein